jgi:hypothetical protein
MRQAKLSHLTGGFLKGTYVEGCRAMGGGRGADVRADCPRRTSRNPNLIAVGLGGNCTTGMPPASFEPHAPRLATTYRLTYCLFLNSCNTSRYVPYHPLLFQNIGTAGVPQFWNNLGLYYLNFSCGCKGTRVIY